MEKRKKEIDMDRVSLCDRTFGVEKDISKKIFCNDDIIKKWKTEFFDFNIDLSEVKKDKTPLFKVPSTATKEEISQFIKFFREQGIKVYVVQAGTGKLEITHKDGTTEIIENFC